jgi:hypothetical protein
MRRRGAGRRGDVAALAARSTERDTLGVKDFEDRPGALSGRPACSEASAASFATAGRRHPTLLTRSAGFEHRICAANPDNKGRREHQMALSDQLAKLSARAKELEDRAAAAKSKGKADLEQDVKEARESAQGQADELRKNAEAGKGKISVWWDDVQRSWNENIAKIRKNVDDRRAEHDAKAAQRAADSADEDAAFAIDYAYAAIEEAEYAVLDADLAHKEADELAAKSG